MGLIDYNRLADFIDDPAIEAGSYVAMRRARAEAFADPLNCEFRKIIRYLSATRQLKWACDCGAKSGQLHGPNCYTTPAYADTVKALDTLPQLISSAISFSFWNLIWDEWDINKYAIRNLEGGQEFPWESDRTGR